MTNELTEATCEPCEGGVPTMDRDEITEHLEKVEDWERLDGEIPKIQRQFEFEDFVEAIGFVNEVTEVAEAEGHHPNLEIQYNEVTVTVWTHAVDGLTRNDFILAAKLDDTVN